MGERNLGNFPISGAVCICGERSGSYFVISIILSLVLPENMKIKKMGSDYLRIKNIFNIVFTMVI